MGGENFDGNGNNERYYINETKEAVVPRWRKKTTDVR
jgi:hypothetical protein